MSVFRVYVAAPKALASEVDAFHRWAHGYVAETRGRGVSLEFTSTGWVQAVLNSGGFDPLTQEGRRDAWEANRSAIYISQVMLAWTALGEPRETFSEVGQWLIRNRQDRLIVVGSPHNAFLSESLAKCYFGASDAESLRHLQPRMVEAIFDAMA